MSWITEEEVQELKQKHPIRGLKVHYGFTKITAKAATKRELIILYENTNNFEYNEKYLNRQHIVYSRNQTQDEIDDAYWSTRSFTKYSYFIDDNKWKGEIHKILYQNFKAHNENTISEFREKDNESKFLALKAIRCGFIKWEGGGISRLTDIDNFSYYKDDKHRAQIKGELREISERDFATLQYVFFGER